MSCELCVCVCVCVCVLNSCMFFLYFFVCSYFFYSSFVDFCGNVLCGCGCVCVCVCVCVMRVRLVYARVVRARDCVV